MGVQHLTEEDYLQITPNDLLLGRAARMETRINYKTDDMLLQRQKYVESVLDMWWDDWSRQVLPSLLPYPCWSTRKRDLRVRDIVLIKTEAKYGRGKFVLARVLETHPDQRDGVVRTVTVGLSRRNRQYLTDPKKFMPLDQITLGVHRLVVVSPMEEQNPETQATETAPNPADDKVKEVADIEEVAAMEVVKTDEGTQKENTAAEVGQGIRRRTMCTRTRT